MPARRSQAIALSVGAGGSSEVLIFCDLLAKAVGKNIRPGSDEPAQGPEPPSAFRLPRAGFQDHGRGGC
jgi:hypothetical protein